MATSISLLLHVVNLGIINGNESPRISGSQPYITSRPTPNHWKGVNSSIVFYMRNVLLPLTPSQHHRPHPPRIVFFHQGIVAACRPLLMAVGLVVHAMKRQRPHPPALRHM